MNLTLLLLIPASDYTLPHVTQISLNINVMMRSLTQALLVLVFMLAASWRLTTITFVLIPLVMTISSVSPTVRGLAVRHWIRVWEEK